jgi:23S rRNA (uridine2552-2'-O)-methyltransferase
MNCNIIDIRKMTKKSRSSKRWLQEHFSDPYVKRAQQEGYRSRASYKLMEIQQQNRILKRGMTVIDLGAAPGGWSEVAIKFIGKEGKVIALDILEMKPINGVEFIHGDFTVKEIQEKLAQSLADQKADAVISDMAPNASGISVVDQARVMHLTELAVKFAQKNLKPHGVFLTKTFQGEGFDELLRNLRANFTAVKVLKPEASRSRSKELYLLARMNAASGN